MKDIVALIPARSGSKGVPNKNIRLLSGIPLIAYSIAVALKSDLIDRVIVSTDSEEYAQISRGYGAEAPFLRPTDISGDTATDTQWISHAIEWFKQSEGYIPQYFVHLRPTTPLRDPSVVDDAIRGFVGNKEYTALLSAHKMSESSYKTFEMEDGKFKRLCDGGFDIERANLARQSFPVTYNANGYVDVIRSELVQSCGQVHGDSVQAYVTETTYEVDEPREFDFLEHVIAKMPGYRASLFEEA
jgi:CMP-N,N'-diacetyllegionaminic acid synthase